MAAQKESNNWMWQHLLKLNNSIVQCNINNCVQTYTIHKKKTDKCIKTIKNHLYHKHKIWNEEDRLKWENDNNLIWRYFDKVDLYEEKCKLCNNLLFTSYIPILRDHLRRYHYQTIRVTIRKEIANMSLSQYFKINEEKFSAKCKHCNDNMDILYGIDELIHHIHFQRNRLSDTSLHRVDVMAAQKRSNNWMWKHFLKLNNSIQCNIDSCNKTYAINKMLQISILKAHLYHKHQIWNEEDRLKWINNNNLIWRYFNKVDLYKEKCKFCGSLFHQAYLPYIKRHLQKHHQEIREIVRKEIANKSLSQYFEIDVEKFNAWCKLCNNNTDIFYGTNSLIHHVCFKKKQSLRSRQKPKDVNTMTQQSIPKENTGIHSYHNIDRQAPRNQDQQRFRKEMVGNNVCRTMQQSVAAENVAISSYNDDNWQAVGYQIDQQRMMHQFVMAENVATSSHNDDCKLAVGCQVDQQKIMHQFVAAENIVTSSHNDVTTWQAPENPSNFIDVLMSF